MTNVVECELCHGPTPMVHTKRCDRCWELERRLIAAPDIARQIMGSIPADEKLTEAVQEVAKLRDMNEALARDLQAQKEKNAKFKSTVVFLQNVRESAIAQRVDAQTVMNKWDVATARAVVEAALSSA